LRPLLVIVIAYLLGSIPFGYLIVRAKEGGDIRSTGSGGTGATNVSRRAGKSAGVITLVLDALKGAAAVIAASLAFGVPLWGSYIAPQVETFANDGLSFRRAYWCIAGAGIAAIIGHMFPVWLNFRGGKGVATGIGVFLMLAPIAVAFAGLIFIVIVMVTRYVSLGSIVAAMSLPVFIWLVNSVSPSLAFAPVVVAAIIGSLLIVIAHRANIRRLLQGSESKFN
jgi:glycerol-3-phosphate acyltransferase PlsY